MRIQDYLSLRRAYSLVRQNDPAKTRLTFEEYCILCHLLFAERPLRTSEIADYQDVLRPTMTHRTNHLHALGLIERFPGEEDKRNVCCSLSDAGRVRIDEIAQACRALIAPGMPLGRSSADRLVSYADAMGHFYCTAADLVLLALVQDPDTPSSISQLVRALGLLQPTISMAIAQLDDEGLVVRNADNPGAQRSGKISLTQRGKQIAASLVEEIGNLVVRRPRASK